MRLIAVGVLLLVTWGLGVGITRVAVPAFHLLLAAALLALIGGVTRGRGG